MEGNVPAYKDLWAIWAGWGGATALPVVTARTTLGEGVPGSQNNKADRGSLEGRDTSRAGAAGEEGSRVSSIFLPPAPNSGPADSSC